MRCGSLPSKVENGDITNNDKVYTKRRLLFRNGNIFVSESASFGIKDGSAIKMVTHLLERPKRMAFVDELGDGSLMESAGDQQNDVVDHVGITARKITIIFQNN